MIWSIVCGPWTLGVRVYVTDKAFAYGNSGRPLLHEGGAAIGVVVRFQPMEIPQNFMSPVRMPTIYSVAAALGNIAEDLARELA